MYEKFPIEGKWWLPDTPNNAVAGRLEYSEQSGPKLVLLGTLESQSKHGLDLHEYQIILGRTHEVSEITLMGCKGTGSHGTLGGETAKETYRPTVMFLGKHFTTQNEIQFKEIYADITHLNTWADFRAITHQYEDNTDIIRATRLPSRNLTDCEGYSLRVFASLENSLDDYSSKVVQSTSLVCSFKNPTPLIEYWPVLRDFQNLLSILVDQPCFPSEIYGIPPNDVRRVTIIRRMAFHKPSKALHPLELLLPLDKMGDRATELIRNWLQKASILRPIHNLALGTIYNESIYAENRFLSITQALESYHRRIKGGNDRPLAEHQARLTTILNAAPAEHKDWLNLKLSHSNEPHLKKRLESLCAQFPNYSRMINERTPDFLTRVVKTRHYLTHFDENNKKGSFASSELYFPSEKLRILFWICMLTEIGYSNTEAETIALNHYEFARILKFN